MADTIGSYSFIRLDGDLSPPMVKNVDISRDGVAGFAYRQLPAKGKETTLRGLAFVSSASAADTLETGYAALCGTSQTLSFRDVSYSNVFVVDVGDFDRKGCFVPGVGLGMLVS